MLSFPFVLILALIFLLLYIPILSFSWFFTLSSSLPLFPLFSSLSVHNLVDCFLSFSFSCYKRRHFLRLVTKPLLIQIMTMDRWSRHFLILYFRKVKIQMTHKSKMLGIRRMQYMRKWFGKMGAHHVYIRMHQYIPLWTRFFSTVSKLVWMDARCQ